MKFLIDSLCFGFRKDEDLLRNEKIFRAYWNVSFNLTLLSGIEIYLKSGLLG